MKKLLIMFALPCLVFQIAGFSRSYAQEKKEAAKTEKHIKIVTIKDGVKEVVDTVIVGESPDLPFSEKDRKFRWISALDACDSVSGIQDFDFDELEGDRVIILKKRHGGDPAMIQRLETIGDSGKKVTVLVRKAGFGDEDVMVVSGDGKKVQRFMTAPLRHGLEGVPPVPSFLHSMKQRNVIDLSDPGIISYKKKKISGGREKITVIRQEAKAGAGEPAGVLSEPDMEVLRKMNEPGVVRELEMLKRAPGETGNRKVEIKTSTDPENK
jgi:hypothetical protein